MPVPTLTCGTIEARIWKESESRSYCRDNRKMITQPSATLLDELLDPVGRCLTPEVARRIVRLRASPALDARIQELGRKCNEGQLSEREQADYETLARFVKFVSVLQSKARTILCESTGE